MALHEPQTSNDTLSTHDSFPLFGKLPLEIRLQIWEHALPEPAKITLLLQPGPFFPLVRAVVTARVAKIRIWRWGILDELNTNLSVRLLLVNHEAHDAFASTYTFLPLRSLRWDELQNRWIETPRRGVLFDYSQDNIRFSNAHCQILKINFRRCVDWFPNVPMRIGKISIERDYVEMTGDWPQFPSMENKQREGNLLLRCSEAIGDGLDSDV